MWCIDGSLNDVVVVAMISGDGDEECATEQWEMPRVLGDELMVLREAFSRFGRVPQRGDSMGIVQTGPSLGALRSMVSLVNAYALGLGISVVPLVREGKIWKRKGSPMPFVLPEYPHEPRITPSKKDALKRPLRA